MDPAAREKRQAKRKREILRATLRLLRRHGSGISTAQIAAEANCSKETLYDWFNDRDGIFMALVEEQARAMGQALRTAFQSVDALPFKEKLTAYSLALVDFTSGEALIAVNRAAMAEACHTKAELGLVVLDDWDSQVANAVRDLMQQGADEGHVAIDDLDEAFDVLVGLLIGDRQRRLLLGEESRPEPQQMEDISAKAVERWLTLFKT